MKTDPLWLAGGIGAVIAIWDLLRARRLTRSLGLRSSGALLQRW